MVFKGEGNEGKEDIGVIWIIEVEFLLSDKEEGGFGINSACEGACVGESGLWLSEDMGFIEARGSQGEFEEGIPYL